MRVEHSENAVDDDIPIVFEAGERQGTLTDLVQPS